MCKKPRIRASRVVLEVCVSVPSGVVRCTTRAAYRGWSGWFQTLCAPQQTFRVEPFTSTPTSHQFPYTRPLTGATAKMWAGLRGFLLYSQTLGKPQRTVRKLGKGPNPFSPLAIQLPFLSTLQEGIWVSSSTKGIINKK